MALDIDDFVGRMKERGGRRIYKNAILLQSRHKRNLSRANPRPHKTPAKRGEYPKARTFNLRDAVVVDRSLAEAIASQRVRCGVNVNAFYGFILDQRGWKGLLDSDYELRSEGAYA